MKPDDKVPTRESRLFALLWFDHCGSSRYADRKKPKAYGKPQIMASTTNAAANYGRIDMYESYTNMNHEGSRAYKRPSSKASIDRSKSSFVAHRSTIRFSVCGRAHFVKTLVCRRGCLAESGRGRRQRGPHREVTIRCRPSIILICAEAVTGHCADRLGELEGSQ